MGKPYNRRVTPYKEIIMIWFGIISCIIALVIFIAFAFFGPLDAECAGAIVLPIGLLILGVVTICTSMETSFKKEAVNKGYAEYVITDKESGITEWKWKCDIKKEK
jgi:hypothetical protein